MRSKKLINDLSNSLVFLCTNTTSRIQHHGIKIECKKGGNRRSRLWLCGRVQLSNNSRSKIFSVSSCSVLEAEGRRGPFQSGAILYLDLFPYTDPRNKKESNDVFSLFFFSILTVSRVIIIILIARTLLK